MHQFISSRCLPTQMHINISPVVPRRGSVAVYMQTTPILLVVLSTDTGTYLINTNTTSTRLVDTDTYQQY